MFFFVLAVSHGGMSTHREARPSKTGGWGWTRSPGMALKVFQGCDTLWHGRHMWLALPCCLSQRPKVKGLSWLCM